MAYDFVPYIGSAYDGWTRDEILAALKDVDEAIRSQSSSAGSGRIQSVSLNGKSITYFDDGAGTNATPMSALRLRKRELMQALALVDDDVTSPSNTTYPSFRDYRDAREALG